MQALSGAFTRPANVVMVWTTHRIQAFRDENPDELTDKVVAQLTPIAHAHINRRGTISFRREKAAKDPIVPPIRPDRSGNLHKSWFMRKINMITPATVDNTRV